MALYSEDSDQKEDAPKGWSIGQLLVSFPTRLTFYAVSYTHLTLPTTPYV